MRQELFRIPLNSSWSLGPLGEVPGFGFGILLTFWILVAGWWAFKNRGELGFKSDLITPVAFWLIIATAIVMVPGCIQKHHDEVIADWNTKLKSVGQDHPHFAPAYAERDRAWWAKRAYADAIEQYRQEIGKDPDFVLARRNLARLQATCPDERFRNGAKAVEHATQAAQLMKFQDAGVLDVLAAAHAEAGGFNAAVQRAKQAADLAINSRAAGRLPDIRKRIQLYLAEKPFRDRSAGSSIPVYGYGFMLVVGLMVAGWSAARRARMVGVSSDTIWDLGMWIFFSGILGARLFYCVQNSERVFYVAAANGQLVMKEGFDLLKAAVNLPDGGLVFYGGVMLGTVTFLLFLYRRRNQLNPLLIADIVIPSVFIGLAFGRLGCLLNGCCYGNRCELPWAVTFPMGSVPDMALVSRGWVGAAETLTLRLHPAQIYSSLNALVLALLTHCYFRHRHHDGAVVAVGLLIYPITRFILEFLRADEIGQFNTPLTISQWVSLGMLAAGLLFLWWLTKRSAPVIRAKRTVSETPSPA